MDDNMQMDDTVRISEKHFRHIYATAFKTWARLFSQATKNCKLPTFCFFTQDTFPLQPAFPRNLDLSYQSYRIIASGTSLWGSSPATCVNNIPSFQRQMELNVAVNGPVLLSISDVTQHNCLSDSCFDSRSNYVSILMLAWAYILSARWADVMPATCSLHYTDSRARYYDATTETTNSQHHLVDIGPATPDEARWWAAVLAQDQGWQANINSSFLSPWSTRFKSGSEFLISAKADTLPLNIPASTFSEAWSFLNRFCMRHRIVDQSHAALAAVLLFPYASGQALQIPPPVFHEPEKQPNAPLGHQNNSLQLHSIIPNGQLLDRLLALSCNTVGIRALLLSVFYEPSIECNAVTPWLQGSLAAIRSLIGDDPSILGRMCMERTPEVACIWLGCTILGLPLEVLQHVQYGQMPFDLNSAAWSGTTQSFIQQPVSKPLVVNDYVQRADECRLLFLCQADDHTRIPISQWKPFGATHYADVDLEVRRHLDCESHQLQYQGFAWNCTETKGELVPRLSENYASQTSSHPNTQEFWAAPPIVWEGLDRSREAISENATRNILTWLRPEGCARNEKEIFQHEWFLIFDSDEEEEEEQRSTKGFKQGPQVEKWLYETTSTA